LIALSFFIPPNYFWQNLFNRCWHRRRDSFYHSSTNPSKGRN